MPSSMFSNEESSEKTRIETKSQRINSKQWFSFETFEIRANLFDADFQWFLFEIDIETATQRRTFALVTERKISLSNFLHDFRR